MSTIKMIPINEIDVLNPRARSRVKFAEIVVNMSKVGIKRPITVSLRGDGKPGYDLVCGQGRIEALKALNQTTVPAIVVDIPREDRYIRSLVENLMRRRKVKLALAREIMAHKERGYSPADTAAKLGITEKYVRDIQRLYEHGEERLLIAVERGEIPVSVAVDIASSDDATVQRGLAEAYERKELRGKAVLKARSLVEARRTRGKSLDARRTGSSTRKRVSSAEIVRAYRRETQRQASLVRKARTCEVHLVIVATTLRELLADEGFVTLLRAEKLDTMPKYLAQQIKAKVS